MLIKNIDKEIKYSKTYFPNLDCLRFFACLLVFNRHTIFYSLKEYKLEGNIFFPIIHFLCNGELGVSFFFVLSGFLITYITLIEQNNTGMFNIKAFYIRRALRIWPLYFFVLVVGFILIPFLSNLYGSSMVIFYNPSLYMLFLSNFDYIKHATSAFQYDVLSITWSVSVEEQFYFVYALMIYLIPKRFYLFVFFLVILGSGIFRFIFFKEPVIIYFHSLSVMSDLAVGALSAWMVINKKRVLFFFESMPRFQIGIILVSGTTYIFLSDYLIQDQYFVFYNRLLISLFFAFVILEQNYSKNSIFKLNRFKIFTGWGKITYGLYLLHAIVIFFLSYVFSKFIFHGNLLASILFYLISFIVSIWVSKISYKYFEGYFLAFKTKF